MGPEAAENLHDEFETAQEQQENQELSETPKIRENVLDITGLSSEDRVRVRSGKASLEDVKKESNNIKDQAENLLELGVGQEKISKKEAKEYKEKLEGSLNKKSREDILEKIQEKISEVQTEKDKTEELEKGDPELQKAYGQYDKLIDEHSHLLGETAAEEYKKWIREQKSSIENIEELTVKFFQSERPPRVETFNKLKNTLGQYGIKSPLDIPYIRAEGLSERKAFLGNIESLEKQFDKMGGMKETLYSKRAEKELVKSVCMARNPQEQEQILKDAQNLERDESSGYASLETAVGAQKISQASMKNMLDYYKTIGKWNGRAENLKLWDSFIENEAKLTDKLKDVFHKEPKNEKGFSLAFRIFKDLDFTGKEKFIDEQSKKREKETSEEELNRELAIKSFKHECAKARKENTISKKTEENYGNWIDKNAEGKSAEEIEEFLKILTAPEANEQYKNLAAYKKRRETFVSDIRTLRDINPLIKEKDAKEWQKKYDKEGWKKREKVHKELKNEINEAKESRIKERLNKAGPEAAKDKETIDTTELAQKNKESAMQAIKDLLRFKAHGSAMKRCVELLKNNPYDKAVLTLMDEIAEIADKQADEADPDKQTEIYGKYTAMAEKMIEQDTETREASDEMQTKEQALELARKDQEQRKSISSHDRTKEDIMDKVKGDDDLSQLAQEYMEGGKDSEILDKDTLEGKKVIEVDFDIEHSRTDQKSLRKQIQQERDKVGEKKGSTVIEFKQAKTGRKLDARSGKEAEQEQRKEKEALAEEMALDIARIMHPDGAPTPEQLAEAKKAALAKLEKKAKTKIERMAA